MQSEKWYAEHLPDGYPTKCSTSVLKDVIQDLNDEYYKRTREGKNNLFWERLITTSLREGNEELSRRKWFSMENPFIYVTVILLIALFAFYLSKYQLPFKL